jgi:hypothetical protein
MSRPDDVWSRRTKTAASIAIRFLLIISVAVLQLIIQPASSFPLQSTTCTSFAQQKALVQPQSVILKSHAHADAECSSEKDTAVVNQQHQQQQRRQVLQTLGLSALSLPFLGLAGTAPPARAADESTNTDQVIADTDRTFVRRTKEYAYQFTPPPNFTPGNKPLKTHMDENNFKSSVTSGWQFGITVDPVRLQSMAEFGTPGEVAAKVVTAEVNRDGVFDVKLMDDPIEQRGDKGSEGTSNGLVLDYLSSGKRGDKRFIAKFFVENEKLYVLTAQCKQADYETVKKELLEAVDSFRVLPM